MKKYDTYIWIKKVIDSCTNYDQEQAAGKLISNFISIFGDLFLTNELLDYKFNRGQVERFKTYKAEIKAIKQKC